MDLQIHSRVLPTKAPATYEIEIKKLNIHEREY